MDKYEYKLRNEQIKTLIKEKQFQEAVEIADTIDWTRVRSVTTLCTISDLYKINRRYSEALILLEQAYEKYPTSKQIVYSLCELCVKMNDIVNATEYYKRYVEMAPTDNNKFILLYKIYELQDVSLEERIEVLEEYKKRDYREKWGYELAYLYHRIGLATKCVEECDELIVWFREGKYVKKAMELKMLHQQLTATQESLYQTMLMPKELTEYELPEEDREDNSEEDSVQVVSSETDEIQVKTMDVGKYSTINIQKALAESMKDVLVAENGFKPLVTDEEAEELNKPGGVTETLLAPMMDGNTGELPEEAVFDEEESLNEEVDDNTVFLPIVDTDELPAIPNREATIPQEDVEPELSDDYSSQSEDVSEEVQIASKSPIEVMATDGVTELKFEDEDSVAMNNKVADKAPENVAATQNLSHIPNVPVSGDTIVYTPHATTFYSQPNIDMSQASKEDLMELINQKVAEALENALNGKSIVERESEKTSSYTKDVVNPPKYMQNVLTQEYDGQIGIVVPEQEVIEQQITGQINIEEFLEDWENTKKQNQERNQEEIKKRVLEQTGTLFTDFDIKSKDGILERLESEDSSEEEIDEESEYKEYIDNILAEDSEKTTETEETDIEPVEEPLTDIEEPIADDAEELDEALEGDIEEDSFDDLNLDEEEVAEDDQNDTYEESDLEEEIDSEEDYSEDDDDLEEDDSDEDGLEEEINEDNSSEERDGTRTLSDEEAALFSPFIQTKSANAVLIKELDNLSLASYTGNAFVTGESTDESIELAKNVVRYAQMTDANFSGKIAKVSGISLNDKPIDIMLEKLANGGLIIEKASGMDDNTIKTMLHILNQDKQGVIVVLQDTVKAMQRMMEQFEDMKSIFNVHIQVEELSDDALVAYGRKYAERQEFAIDEMGMLALHTRIESLQTSDHIVTVVDVREIIDEAIKNATKKNFRHFSDVLLGKRYDEEDMIILKEKDFNIY